MHMPLAFAGGMVGVYMGPPLLAPSSLSLSGDLGTKYHFTARTSGSLGRTRPPAISTIHHGKV